MSPDLPFPTTSFWPWQEPRETACTLSQITPALLPARLELFLICLLAKIHLARAFCPPSSLPPPSLGRACLLLGAGKP